MIPADELFDGDIRVDKIIWIAGQYARWSDDFETLVDDEGNDGVAKIAGIKRIPDDAEYEDVVQILGHNQKNGFFVLCSTPVPECISDNGTFTCSWGHFTEKWFYTDSLDDKFVTKKVIPWKDRLMRKAVRKYKERAK